MKKEQFIKMNIAIAGYTQGQQWHYEKAPAVVRMWLEKKAILFETKICGIVTEDGKFYIAENNEEKQFTAQEKAQIKIDNLSNESKEENPAIKAEVIKKKRGRPKGSTLKKKITTEG